MPSGTLSLRSPSVAQRTISAMLRGAPPRAATSATDMAASWRARTSRLPAAPVLPASIASEIRDSLSPEPFLAAFDALFDAQSANDPSPALERCDRTVLRCLLSYRWCVVRPTSMEIADRVGREVKWVRCSLARLKQSALLPCGDSL